MVWLIILSAAAFASRPVLCHYAQRKSREIRTTFQSVWECSSLVAGRSLFGEREDPGKELGGEPFGDVTCSRWGSGFFQTLYSLRLTELLSCSLGTRHAYVRHLYNYSSNFQIWFFICLNQNGAAPASDQEFIASVRDSRILKKWINYYIVDNRYRRVDTGIIPGVQASKSVH